MKLVVSNPVSAKVPISESDFELFPSIVERTPPIVSMNQNVLFIASMA